MNWGEVQVNMTNDQILDSIISDVYEKKRKITLLHTKENREKLVSYLEHTEIDAAVFVAREILCDDSDKQKDVPSTRVLLHCKDHISLLRRGSLGLLNSFQHTFSSLYIWVYF